MTTIWVAGLGGLLLLCLGTLMGTSWTDQAMDRRYRRLALARRELNEWRHTLQEINQHCVWCGNPVLVEVGDLSEVGGRASTARYADPSPAGTALAVGERR